MPPEAFLASAARHYLAESGNERIATKLPEFATPIELRGRFIRDLAARLPRDLSEAMLSRAADLGVSAQHLLQHAALLYLADIHAGRVEPMIEDELGTR